MAVSQESQQQFTEALALVPLCQKIPELALSDPPKRIFAATEKSTTGETDFAFPYISEEDIVTSAKKAAAHPEVILSHHLHKACKVLGRPCGPGGVRHKSVFYEVEAREAIPSLKHIVEWLLEKAVATDEDGETVGDVDPGIFQLKVLEQLAGLWGQGTYDYTVGVSGPTLEEMRIALEDSCGDVVEAFLRVARDQARRREVKEVRDRLSQEDELMVVRYNLLNDTLDSVKGDVEEAVAILLKEWPGHKQYIRL